MAREAQVRYVVEEERRHWLVTQILDDPDGDLDWAMVFDVDLDASDEAGEPVLAVRSLAWR